MTLWATHVRARQNLLCGVSAADIAIMSLSALIYLYSSLYLLLHLPPLNPKPLSRCSLCSAQVGTRALGPLVSGNWVSHSRHLAVPLLLHGPPSASPANEGKLSMTWLSPYQGLCSLALIMLLSCLHISPLVYAHYDMQITQCQRVQHQLPPSLERCNPGPDINLSALAPCKNTLEYIHAKKCMKDKPLHDKGKSDRNNGESISYVRIL